MMVTRKICVITATRSEYGLLRWVIDNIYRDVDLDLQLVVTGTHLLEKYGYTCKEIERDGYPIAAKVDMHLESSTREDIAKSMGYCSIRMAETLRELEPDLVVVLGDRYELLPICGAALVMNIPIAHISGGDLTTGAIDNEIRNAVTMMATLHFPGIPESADNIARMRNSKECIFTTGEPGLDNFKHFTLWSREKLAKELNIDVNNRWVMITLHPETQNSLEYNLNMAENIIRLTDSIKDTSVVITKANADFGGIQINEYWEKVVVEQPLKYRLYSSLGQLRYLSFMKECFAVIGNSSSGIVEAPCLGIPVLNIGNRQKGRHLCGNILQVNNNYNEITKAWQRCGVFKEKVFDYYYGDSNASEKIVKCIKFYFDDK